MRSFGLISSKIVLIFLQSFLSFRLDMNENQGIINFSSYNSKSYASVVLRDSKVVLLKEEEDVASSLFLNCF